MPDTALVDELRSAFRALPVADDAVTDASEKAWSRSADRLRTMVLHDDPQNFLHWDVIVDTMFVRYSGWVAGEFDYLRNHRDWETRWRRAIAESRVGNPDPYPFHPASSANLIHHCYHLARFEDATGYPLAGIRSVFEFGGGYGSMCRLLHNLGFNGSYLIHDLPHFSALQRYYCKSVGLNVHPHLHHAHQNPGVTLVSDMDELRAIAPALMADGTSLFIATWSLSETPFHIRDALLPLLKQASALLIAYQECFSGLSNSRYFTELRMALPEIAWHVEDIRHLPGNSYCFGNSHDRARDGALPDRCRTR